MNLQRLIEQYISFQQSLGLAFVTNAYWLRVFCRVCGPRVNVAGVRIQHVDTFLGTARPVTRTWFDKLNLLRRFFQYAVSRGYATTAPFPAVLPKYPLPFIPYIYSRDEIRRLLRATELRTRNRRLEPVTIRTMLLVYYAAGLRLHEAINLTCADVDLKESILTIRNTKFGKTRLVPIGSQLTRALVQYDRTRPKHRPADAPFFTTRAGAPVLKRTLESNFNTLRNLTGIRRTGTRQQPRIHDLRHTFAVHRLTAWYQQGKDVQRLLYHLSVYLGHVDLASTQVYLSLTPELLHEASQRFERYAGKEQDHV